MLIKWLKLSWQQFRCWLGHDWHWVLARYRSFHYRSVTSQCRRCKAFRRQRLKAETVYYAGFELTDQWKPSPYDRVPLISDTI